MNIVSKVFLALLIIVFRSNLIGMDCPQRTYDERKTARLRDITRDGIFHVSEEMVQLVKEGADPNMTVNVLWVRVESLLRFFIQTGVVREYVVLLLSHGANPNDETGPLHAAVSKQPKYITELLIKAGADVNLVNRQNKTPLELAIKTDSKSLISLLLSYGARSDDERVAKELANAPAAIVELVKEHQKRRLM